MSAPSKATTILLCVLFLALSLGCETADTGATGDENLEPTGAVDDDYGKPLLGTVPQPGKGDSLSGARGLPVSVDGSDTAVWEVENAWADTDTPAARAAGVAWGPDSGLSWDEKYARWVRTMRKIDGYETYYETYELTTPWGTTLPAPNLECAETSIFLRVTFAAWYRLPFYMVAGSGSGAAYFGHFGARTADGRYPNTPRFRDRYADYRSQFEGMSAEQVVTMWPHDTGLQARRLGSSGDDLNDFLGPEAYAGAYFDEIFLNKRVGHFLVFILSYYGSIHLASSQNTFNLAPEAVREGDSLLERWQATGIGHTLIVKTVTDLGTGTLEAELVSGSMPRRQGKWEDGAASKSYFTNPYTGGDDLNEDGRRYAELGGGLKRWRVATARSGYWYLDVPASDTNVWINSTDYDGIGARPERFASLLDEVAPADHRDMLLGKIDDARNHLRNYPASCAARERREEAFEELYTLMQTEFAVTAREVDERYRILDDYVFAELVYSESRTCCWNSTNADMYAAIMAYARSVVEGSGAACTPPPVFKVTDGGYDAFASFAAANDYPNWVAWSEDEPCAQRDTANDVEMAHAWTDPCLFMPILLGDEDRPSGDPEEPSGDDPGSGPDCARAPLPTGPARAGGAPLALLFLGLAVTRLLRR